MVYHLDCLQANQIMLCRNIYHTFSTEIKQFLRYFGIKLVRNFSRVEISIENTDYFNIIELQSLEAKKKRL